MSEKYLDELEQKYLKKDKKNNNYYFYIFLIFLIVLLYLFNLNRVTVSESCEVFLENNNAVDRLENEFISINDEIVDTWNAYIDLSITEEYVYLSAEEQIEVHMLVNIYDIESLSIREKELIDKLSNIKINDSEVHANHLEMLMVFNDVVNYQIQELKLINEQSKSAIVYIENIEEYYRNWDDAFNQDNVELMASLTKDFENYDLNWTETFNEKYNEIEIARNNNPLIEFQNLADELCNISFES